MKKCLISVFVAALCQIISAQIFAQQPFRLSDKQVKQLTARISKGTENFSKKLQRGLKKGEIQDSAEALQNAADLAIAARRLNESVSKKRSPNADVDDLLGRARHVDQFMKANPVVTQADPEWAAVAVAVEQLANGFGLQWPNGSSTQRASRVTDDELKQLFERAAKNAERFKRSLEKELSKEKSLDRGQRSNINQTVSQFEKAVQNLKKNWTEVAALANDYSATLRLWSGLKDFLGSRTSTPATQAQWDALTRDLTQIAAAYRIEDSISR